MKAEIGVTRFIDLSHPLEHGQPNFPWDPKLTISVHNTVSSIGYNITAIGISSHQGTHLDAPFHFAEGKWTTEQIPLGQTIGPGVVIDLRRNADKDRDYLLKVDDLRAWEKLHGRLPAGAIVLIHTGWGKYWGDRKRTKVTPSCEATSRSPPPRDANSVLV